MSKLQEHSETIVQQYINGTSGPLLAKAYGCAVSSIYSLLKKHNVRIRSNKENYKQNIRHDYFNKIDSYEKAYWLGFIAADGCILDRAGKSLSIKIDLDSKDKNHLEKFAEDIGLEPNKVKIYKYAHGTAELARITLCSDELCKAVKKYNVVPRKTHIYTFPEKLPNKYRSSFILGYFDGDGCITKGPSFKITGTETFLLSLQNELIQNCQLKQTKLQIRHKDRINNIRSLEYGGKYQIKRIFEYLYKKSTRYLERKRNKFIELLCTTQNN